MNDNTTFMMTQVISIVGTFIVTIASVIITQIFYSKNQEKKEQKEDERNRRRELKEPYEQLMKYINSVPLKAPKDIIEKINDKGQYDKIYVDQLKNYLEKQVKKFWLDKNIARRDFENLYLCIFELSHAFTAYKNSEKVYNEFRKKYLNVFNMYAPYEIKLDLFVLNVTVISAFTNFEVKEASSFVDIRYKNKTSDSIENMKIRFINDIRKDLGIK